MLLLFLLVAFACGEKLWNPAPEDNVIDGTLRQVHIVFRHGHREPKSGYPNDPNKDTKIWKNGPGHLTILGRQQANEFGQNLRARYKNLLPKERAWKAVKAISSDVHRTLMTCSVVLAGLLPPSDEDQWSELNWQPAAVHTGPTNTDNIVASHPECPQYDQLLSQLPNKISQETRFLYKYVRKHSGKKIKDSFTLSNLYTCLDIQQQAGLTLPDWVEPIMPAMKLESARSLTETASTVALARLRAGPLLQTLTNYEIYPDIPVRLYSTHDTVLSGLLGALNISVDEPPNFVSTLIIEHRELNNQIHAQLWYRSRPKDNLKLINFPGCDVRCPLDKLLEILNPIIPKNWSEECWHEERVPEIVLTQTNPEKNVEQVPALVFMLAVGIILTVLGVFFYRNRSDRVAYENL